MALIWNIRIIVVQDCIPSGFGSRSAERRTKKELSFMWHIKFNSISYHLNLGNQYDHSFRSGCSSLRHRNKVKCKVNCLFINNLKLLSFLVFLGLVSNGGSWLHLVLASLPYSEASPSKPFEVLQDSFKKVNFFMAYVALQIIIWKYSANICKSQSERLLRQPNLVMETHLQLHVNSINSSQKPTHMA